MDGTINYYGHLERVGYIDWAGAPDFWFGRDDVTDPELLALLDNPDLSVSGTVVVFEDGGVTEASRPRHNAIRIQRKPT